jgi:hypothetical protein
MSKDGHGRRHNAAENVKKRERTAEKNGSRRERNGNSRVFGALERTRTSDPQLRKLVLYPLSYERARTPMVPFGPFTTPEVPPSPLLLHSPAILPITPMSRESARRV